MTATASFSLAGKVALVTGGASGIGTGIVAVLAEAGATVVIADRDEALAKKEVAALAKAGHRAGIVLVADLADEASIVRACAETISAYGTPWVLVNNAGSQDRELLLEGTVAEWDRMMVINARGPFLMTREIARAMVAQGQGGRIVNIASAALVGCMVQGGGPYAASKGALLAFGRASALELVEHRITVNTVLPGGVDYAGRHGRQRSASMGTRPLHAGARPERPTRYRRRGLVFRNARGTLHHEPGNRRRCRLDTHLTGMTDAQLKRDGQKMYQLGIENLSVFGMPPVEYVNFAADLGCQNISNGLTAIDYEPARLRQVFPEGR